MLRKGGEGNGCTSLNPQDDLAGDGANRQRNQAPAEQLGMLEKKVRRFAKKNGPKRKGGSKRGKALRTGRLLGCREKGEGKYD